MFEHKKFTLPDYQTKTVGGHRHYVVGDDKIYPSVTTVLSHLSDGWVAEWKARVGEEEANKVSTRAKIRGTKLHKILEDYINNRLDRKKLLPVDKQLFNDLQPLLKENLGLIWGQEIALFSDYLKVAGRSDLIAEWRGKLSIVDYKTSKRIKEKKDIENYFIQCALYAIMFEEITGVPINNLVVIIMVDQDKPLIFEEKRKNYDSKCVEVVRHFYENIYPFFVQE